MQTYDFSLTCSECSGHLVDAEDELVCPGCGVVSAKEVIEEGRPRDPVAIDFTGQALGGYLGPIEARGPDRRARGFSTSNSSYDYLKLMSDYAGREDGAIYTCAKMVERVCERLHLPNVIMVQAVAITKKLLSAGVHGRRVTLGTISAYSIAAACKTTSNASASLREIVDAHREMGRRVTFSSLIQLSLSSPIKTVPRRAEQYVGRVIVKIAADDRLNKELENEGVNRNVYFNTLRITAAEILESIDENSKAGRRPCALAATAVYAAELLLANAESRKRRITQRLTAACGDTAEYTVREQYQVVFMPAKLSLRLAAGLSLPPPRAS